MRSFLVDHVTWWRIKVGAASAFVSTLLPFSFQSVFQNQQWNSREDSCDPKLLLYSTKVTMDKSSCCCADRDPEDSPSLLLLLLFLCLWLDVCNCVLCIYLWSSWCDGGFSRQRWVLLIFFFLGCYCGGAFSVQLCSKSVLWVLMRCIWFLCVCLPSCHLGEHSGA